MFENHNFYLFILLFLFAFLLIMFNAFIPHHYFVDIVTWIMLTVPILGFVYLLKFRNGDVRPFYILFSVLLVAYVFVFAGTKIYAIFNPPADKLIKSSSVNRPI